jgi:putative ABC transport system permease protein
VLLEFALLGGLAGLVSAALASAISYSLATLVFELPWQFDPRMWFIALGGGTLGVGLAGTAASWHLFNTPPIAVLRRA